MGVNLRELIPERARREVDLRALRGREVALDAYNMLYQFLAAIRQPDGTPLMDRQGRITSHLSGLFYRTVNLVEEGLKPVFVFDGKPPEMKKREIEERIKAREQALVKYRQALEAGRIEEARKYAQATGRLTNEMVEEAKRLLQAMGMPVVQAPAEGEAQAACMASAGKVWATGSQDYDSLLFGSPRLARNLAVTGRRKLPGRDEYVEVKPEIIELDTLLKELGITREQLIVIGILLGTDYNPGGVRGYGPKTALKLVKSVGDPLKALRAVPKIEGEADPVEIYEYFLKPPCTTDYRIEWRPPDEKGVTKILVEEHDFNPDRVSKALERLKRAYREHLRARQSRLDAWF
ncbi:MAG: flap endonuclease-1 [Desulfurococcales archaeon]|nr:flap endonuclease-1 [Desulfurococcales archaeon]